MKFMFESNSEFEPNYDLMYEIPNIGELQALNVDIHQSNFFGKFITFRWFKTMLIFVSIQMKIYEYKKKM